MRQYTRKVKECGTFVCPAQVLQKLVGGGTGRKHTGTAPLDPRPKLSCKLENKVMGNNFSMKVCGIGSVKEATEREKKHTGIESAPSVFLIQICTREFYLNTS